MRFWRFREDLRTKAFLRFRRAAAAAAAFRCCSVYWVCSIDRTMLEGEVGGVEVRPHAPATVATATEEEQTEVVVAVDDLEDEAVVVDAFVVMMLLKKK